MVKLPTESRYWHEADGRRVIEAWQRSGETAAAFAQRHGLNTKRLAYWRKRLVAEPPSSMSLVPATVVMPDELAAVIRVPNDVTIELAHATPAQIAEVALAVARSSS